DIAESDGQIFIVMEYIDGVTLEQKILHRAMEPKQAVEIAIEVTEGLREAHKKHIIHRDLKSSNILITGEQHAKILDFGLAKQLISEDELSELSTTDHLTEPGVVMGTVSYMSPEQALGHEVDHRSDIFSFGIVLYEMLTGHLPFGGRSTTETIDAILHKEP